MQGRGFSLLIRRRACSALLSVLGCVLLLHGASCLALGTEKPLREYGQQSWQSDSGLPQNTVHAILQTRDGFLWIGTEAGLVRFDGIDFALYSSQNTPQLHSDVISSLVEDGQGTLWIGTADGVASERAGVFSAYGVGSGLPSETVLALELTRHGELLALTSGGVALFKAGRFALLPGTERLGLSEGASLFAEDAEHLWFAGLGGVASMGADLGPNQNPGQSPDQSAAAASSITAETGQLQAIAVDAAGELWLGGANGLLRLAAGRSATLVARASLPSPDITSLLSADDGMWIGTSQGLAWARRNTISTVPELAGRRVQALFKDRAGALWVATSEGVARIAHGKVDLGAEKTPLTGVLCFYEDREGSMWFGTETAGLHVMRDQAFSTLTVDDGLSASLVRAVFEDHAGTLWIGTSGGGLDRVTAVGGKGGHVSTYPGRLPSKVILALAETDAETSAKISAQPGVKTGAAKEQKPGNYDLWVGTPEGLARLRGDQTRIFTTADGLADDFVRSLYADRDGSLWIGTRNGLSHRKEGRLRSYSQLDGLPSDLVGTILRRRDGVLLAGTLAGLSQMRGDTFVPFQPGGLPPGAVTALLEDRQGTLWVGINDRGLSRVKAGVVTECHGSELPKTIFGMLEDASGSLWLSSRTGVDRVSLASLDAAARGQSKSVEVTHYGSADGMRISEASGGGHPAAWSAHDGGLWFATLNGAAVTYPQAGPRDAVAPLPAIEQVLVDDRPLGDRPVTDAKARATIEIAPGQGRFSIHYAGLSFVAPQRVRYRYRLEGFDKDWVEAGTRRTAFYTNVPPGSYRFLVKCANSSGVWSLKPAEQRLALEPYFYQTGWFYVAVATMLTLLGYLAYKARVHTVEAQYRAVAEERNRIAREIHDTLAQGYVAISVQLELAERLLATSTDAGLQQLRQTRDLARQGLVEARSSIWNLRAQADAQALPSLLADYVAAALKRQAGDATVRFFVHGEYRPLAHRVEAEVARIAQQAIANALAHAQARNIAATLTYEAQWLTLSVVDDGVGMSLTASKMSRRGHYGLQGMRERAERIGASLAIESELGAGVRVTMRLALKRWTEREA